MTEIAADTVLTATGNKARLAKVYAEALLSAASKAGLADPIGEELWSIGYELVARHPRIAAFLDSAAITRKSKLPALGAAFTNRTSLLFQQFLGVLNQNGRLGLLRDIAVAYRDLQDRLAGRVRIQVTAAAPLSDDQAEQLKGTLAESLKKTPILSVQVNPDLLGGLVVQVGDRVYDTSVRTRLETLRNHLLASGTHVVQA